ncbi:DUF1007 family protein [Chelativorans alearense]|uniref:DUF1007 family protein n=1 Tax=Chelativorans alearense TaxID=2681495 RepID=UPI0013D6CEC7|nr:DUF1007 family protein [Chelativorans alearense]
MIRGLFIAALVTVPVAAAAHPHSYTDQQVQLSVGLEVVDLSVVIVPSTGDGAAIFSHIDLDGDGAVSDEEAQAFGADVLATAELTVDRRVFAFTNAAVAVPSAEEAARGTGAIIVKASTPISLSETEAHQVDFGISYGAFSHDWFIQPFFHPDLIEKTSSRSVDRTKASGDLIIRFNRKRVAICMRRSVRHCIGRDARHG